ncbi:hypothetical protein BGZ95_006253 [Linnemannia exigua]|uniref:Uncharacterized protein n=1 Tax=Linnemannia exigua TaxID=604196 RepID=A0AAD4DG87_9FUNG|nr:hypothetical protein BGZ95_006253 [Linnemannia exigua]
MSTPTLRKSNSSSSRGVKKCLKFAIGLVALSQFSIAQACSPSTIRLDWELVSVDFCKGKACADDSKITGMMYLNIRGRYEKQFYYQTPKNRITLQDIGKHCSPDGNFCIEFYGYNDATLHYANKKFKLGSPNARTGGLGLGSAEYWHCL